MEPLQELQEQLERFKAMGLDMNTIQTAMQSTFAGGTTTLGLNRWSLNDKPTMEDFNRDNEIIDREIQGLRGELVKKADKGTPSLFPVDFKDTYEGPDSYMYKDSENKVHLYINATYKNGYIPHADTVFTLPEGFQPNGREFIVGSVVLINEDDRRVPAFMAYHSDNKSISVLKMYGTYDEGFKRISGGFYFLAQ